MFVVNALGVPNVPMFTDTVKGHGLQVRESGVTGQGIRGYRLGVRGYRLGVRGYILGVRGIYILGVRGIYSLGL